MLRKIKHLTFPLRTALVTAVVTSATLVIVLAIGSIGVPAYWQAKKAVQGLWEDLAKEASESATSQVLRYFQSAPVTLRFISDLADTGHLQITNLETQLDVCYRALKENPDFMSLYYSTIEGTFYGVFRIADGFQGAYRTIEADGKTRMRNYKIGPDNVWVSTDEQMGDYDPRKRPFWKTGKEHPEGGWSKPYQFATIKARGYTYVLSQKGKEGISGYWAIDFEIDQLGDYLQSLKIGKEGIVYIIADDGTQIAQSTPQIIKAEGNQQIQEAWNEYIDKKEARGFLNVAHRITYAQRFPIASEIPWNLITMIHEDDFLTPIRQSAYHSLAIGLIPCVLFLALSAVFFGRISNRLKEFASEMDEVGNLSIQFREKEIVPSRIREINTMNHSLHKMKIGLKSFSKYVPIDLIKKLLQSGHSAKLGGVKQDVTVLFADMVQFTTLAEQIGPDEIAHIIEKFLTAASREVHREKGIVDKFMGDAVMALWGVPDPIPDPALAACRAALAMQKIASSSVLMNHRIGINSGNALVGNLGSHERMDFTAMGDAVNIAARLEKLNKRYGTKILIGPDTAKAVEDVLLVRPLDYVMLQGRTHVLVVYELLMTKQEAPEELLQAVFTYTSALEAYRKQEFSKAAPLFDESRRLFKGTDIPSYMLAERCRFFEKKPPPDDWNGTDIRPGEES